MTASISMVKAVTDTLESLASPHSRRAYSRHLIAFTEYHRVQSSSMAGTVRSFLRSIPSPSSRIQALAAIRALTKTLAEREELPKSALSEIQGIKIARSQTCGRLGNWLTLDQARAILTNISSQKESLKRTRNSALWAVLIGTGMRREEISALCWRHLQIRENRHVFLNITGKRNKTRTIAIPDWVVAYLLPLRDTLQFVATDKKPHYGCKEIGEKERLEPIFRAVKTGRDGKERWGGRLTASGIWWIVKNCGREIGVEIAPHDCRRTFAALAKEAGAEIGRVQEALGHASVRTTEIYLNKIQNFRAGEAAGDKFAL